jgi:hypothetical protein
MPVYIGKILTCTKSLPLTDNNREIELAEHSLAISLVDAQAYLNNQVATELYKQFGISIRVRLVVDVRPD